MSAALMLVMITSLVFAHGGACAAVIMSESDGHVLHETVTVLEMSPDADCRHHDLPPGHRHGTEQECSATDPPSVQVPSAAQAVLAIAAHRRGRRVNLTRCATAPLPTPDRVNIRVMRI
ncbi:hypothetical protein ABZT47_10740 [Sphaerisporangium sp. NPDC005289]